MKGGSGNKRKKTHNIEGMEGGREKREEKGGCGEGKKGGQKFISCFIIKGKRIKEQQVRNAYKMRNIALRILWGKHVSRGHVVNLAILGRRAINVMINKMRLLAVWYESFTYHLQIGK